MPQKNYLIFHVGPGKSKKAIRLDSIGYIHIYPDGDCVAVGAVSEERFGDFMVDPAKVAERFGDLCDAVFTAKDTATAQAIIEDLESTAQEAPQENPKAEIMKMLLAAANQ